MAKLSMHRTVEGLGDYLREQRGQAQMSLRQLSELTDVSNPYLSQIERGLRRPSAEVLQQIAKALRISAESLYVRAGILDADDHGARMVEDAIALDPLLTERQKSALLDIYRSFVGTDQATDTELATTVTAANQPGASRPETAPTEENS
jgi:transcriptional regulator with XRE-family HTH domain